MKEATGELSTTVIAVVAIGLIATLFATVVLPLIRRQINASVYCASAVNCDCSQGNGDVCECHYYIESDNEAGMVLSTDTIQCPNKDGNR